MSALGTPADIPLAPGRRTRRGGATRPPRSGCRSAATAERDARSAARRSSPSAGSTTGAAPSASRGFMDRTLVEFFYRYWFRAEVEGIENVPAEGGALLVSNHSGALPPDAAMIAQGDPRGAPEPAAALPDGRALLQGLSGLLDADPEDRRRRRPPGERAPAAVRRAPAGARLPRGPQGDREALQGPLPAAALRPRRLRRGGDARRGEAGPALRRRGRGGGADLRPRRPRCSGSPA